MSPIPGRGAPAARTAAISWPELDAAEEPPGLDWRAYEADDGLHPILRVSLELFVTRGYHGTSIRTIAQAAGLTGPGLYYHYQHKRQILTALIQRAHAELRVRTRAALADTSAYPRARFTAFVEAVVLFMTHRWRLSLIPQEIESLEDSLADRHRALRRGIQVELRRIVEEGVADGSFATADAAGDTRAIFVLCRGIAQWYQPDGPRSPDEIAADYVRYALAIVQAQEVAR